MATFKSKGFGAPPTIEDASPNLDEPEAFQPPEDEPQAEQGAAHRSPFPRRREPTQPMNFRVPLALFEELRDFTKESEIPMTEIAVAGIRKELAALKKKYGVK
jgi:hypothetical protein